MQKNVIFSSPFFSLGFADGQKFILHPTDNQAAEIVNMMSDVMHLSPGTVGREIFVCVSDKKEFQINNLKNGGPLVCCLLPGTNPNIREIQMSELARYIAAQMIPGGGMLIHGGLIRHGGQGFILAAPGGTGKTTACNRLPESWDALSDDATMVVQTDEGRYLAHPWPTWSRFLDGGSGGDWNVEEAVPLSSIFFLQRSEIDNVEPLSKVNATAFLMESIRQVMLTPRIGKLHSDSIEAILKMSFPHIERLILSIPVQILQISLSGNYWEGIFQSLKKTEVPKHPAPLFSQIKHIDKNSNIFNDQSIPVIYSGPSMNPSFLDSDLLEVVPYGRRPFKVGDVIYFFSPVKETHIIHRIVSISENGVQTRGDNNPAPDPELVLPGEIIGRVIAVSRTSGTWKVTGGTSGRILQAFLLARKSILAKIDYIILSKNPVGVFVHIIRCCFAYIMRPRYVLFSTRYSFFLKLYIGNRLIGDYNTIRMTWMIRSPFSLFIDRTQLPTLKPPLPKIRFLRELGH